MLTKEQLTDAHEQGLWVILNGRKVQIVAIIMDVVAVKALDSDRIIWLHLDSFFKGECIIEQPKPKYNGRSVKCETLEQLRYIATRHKSEYINHIESNFKDKYFYYDLGNDAYLCERDLLHRNYEIISFSDYCKENNITEPKWIQGFEVRDGYNDVVMVSVDNKTWWTRRLLRVINSNELPFETEGRNYWNYCRLLRKEEINEIKFVK